MNAFVIALGSGIVAFILMQCYGAARFKGGSNGLISFVFGVGVGLIVIGILS